MTHSGQQGSHIFVKNVIMHSCDMNPAPCTLHVVVIFAVSVSVSFVFPLCHRYRVLVMCLTWAKRNH